MTDAAAARPLAGRRFHLMGIGGAGVSALAQLGCAWGAEVSGCDPAPGAYAELARAAGAEVLTGHDPAHVGPGVELVVSSAVPADHPERQRAEALGLPVRLRGELLGEWTGLVPSVVVAGAHGKSTTTAMVAHAATALGLDPSVAVGGIVPSLGGNVRTGSGGWFVVEGDESDRTLRHLRARVAVVTNVERDHHHTYASDAEVEELFAGWLASQAVGTVCVLGPDAVCDRLVASCPGPVVRTGTDEPELDRLRALLPVPGRVNALNAASALAALEAMGSDRAAAEAALGSFAGVERRFQVVGEAGGSVVVDDYAHHPTEVAATVAAARDRWPGRGLTVVFQPHLFSRTQALADNFGAALAAADRVVLLPVYGAREQPMAGVTSALVADAVAARSAAAVTLLDEPAATCDASSILGTAMDGDAIITMGAGDVTTLAPRLVAALEQRDRDGAAAPSWLQRDVDLARHTTIGTGGRARWFATPQDEVELLDALAWAREHGERVAVLGLGSNTLVADAGFPGLVLRLSGALAAIEVDVDALEVRAGGGASLAAIVRRCRDAGLAGFEFACAIPGTVGGAVRMNAGAYGTELVDVLGRARVVGPDGPRDVAPDALRMQYRHTALRPDEVVAGAVLRLRAGDPAEIKATVQGMQDRRRSTQPKAARSFGSVFRNPTIDRAGNPAPGGAGALVEACGLRGHEHGGARISPVHGNFVENTGGATTADVLALVALARAAVLERFDVDLVPEVHLLDGEGHRALAAALARRGGDVVSPDGPDGGDRRPGERAPRARVRRDDEGRPVYGRSREESLRAGRAAAQARATPAAPTQAVTGDAPSRVRRRRTPAAPVEPAQVAAAGEDAPRREWFGLVRERATQGVDGARATVRRRASGTIRARPVGSAVPVGDPRRTQRRAVRSKQRTRAQLVGAGVVLALGLLLLLWHVVPRLGVFSVRSVEIHGNHRITTASAQSAIRKAWVGTTVFTADDDQIRSTLERLPFVRSVTVRHDLPHKLVVDVVEYQPLAIGVSSTAGFWLVANDGRVLVQAKLADWRGRVPRVRLSDGDVHAGDRLTDEATLQLLQAEPQGFPTAVASVDEQPSGLVVTLRGGLALRFGDASLLAGKWASAQRILQLYARHGAPKLDHVDVSVPSRPAPHLA